MPAGVLTSLGLIFTGSLLTRAIPAEEPLCAVELAMAALAAGLLAGGALRAGVATTVSVSDLLAGGLSRVQANGFTGGGVSGMTRASTAFF